MKLKLLKLPWEDRIDLILRIVDQIIRLCQLFF